MSTWIHSICYSYYLLSYLIFTFLYLLSYLLRYLLTTHIRTGRSICLLLDIWYIGVIITGNRRIPWYLHIPGLYLLKDVLHRLPLLILLSHQPFPLSRLLRAVVLIEILIFSWALPGACTFLAHDFHCPLSLGARGYITSGYIVI